MNKGVDRTVQLHYIDKVHSALKETGESISRVVIFQTLLSLITIALSAGVIFSDTDYTVSGFTFHVSFPLVLVSGAVAVGCLLMSQLGLVQHEDNLRDTVLRLYRELGYDDMSMANPLANPLESPNVVTIILNLYSSRSLPGTLHRLLYTSSRVLFFALFLLLPLVAQIVTCYRMVILFGWQWWLLLPVFVFTISAVYVILYFRAK